MKNFPNDLIVNDGSRERDNESLQKNGLMRIRIMLWILRQEDKKYIYWNNSTVAHTLPDGNWVQLKTGPNCWESWRRRFCCGFFLKIGDEFQTE